MTSSNRCPYHAVAVTACALCIGLPMAAPFLETRPETMAIVTPSNQPIQEPDKPLDPGGALFLIQPGGALVSAVSIAEAPVIPTLSSLIPPKLK